MIAEGRDDYPFLAGHGKGDAGPDENIVGTTTPAQELSVVTGDQEPA